MKRSLLLVVIPEENLLLLLLVLNSGHLIRAKRECLA